MSAEWFFVNDGKEVGPFSAKHLKDLADSGSLERTQLLRRADKKKIVRAEKVAGLFTPQPPSETSSNNQALNQVTTKRPPPPPSRLELGSAMTTQSAASISAIQQPPTPPPSNGGMPANTTPAPAKQSRLSPNITLLLGVWVGLGLCAAAFTFLAVTGRFAPLVVWLESAGGRNKGSAGAESQDKPEKEKASKGANGNTSSRPAGSTKSRPADSAQPDPADGKHSEQSPDTLDDPNLLGPNGEQLLSESFGPNSKCFHRYYINTDGHKVLHGTSLDYHFYDTGDSDKPAPLYEKYDNGRLITKHYYDTNGRLMILENYESSVSDEYRLLRDGSIVHLRSTMTVEDNGPKGISKILSDTQVVPDETPLPPVAGRKLLVTIGTPGIETMKDGGWIQRQNASIGSAKCVATDRQLIIDFEVDNSNWSQSVLMFPLLVRLFDKNGQHLTHFRTAEGFTVHLAVYSRLDGTYQRLTKNGSFNQAAKYDCRFLKPKGNRLVYPVNVRDLRDAAIVEIGFVSQN